MSKRKSKKYSNEFKLMVVLEYLGGSSGGYSTVAKKYGISSSSLVKKWVSQYRSKGLEGLDRSRSKREYPLELKLKILEMHETTELSYKDLATEYGVKDPTTIAGWKRRFKEGGVAGLCRKRGRPRVAKQSEEKTNSGKRKRKSDMDPKDIRIAELEYELRLAKIRNEYLELLRSVEMERMNPKQESSTSSGASTN